jgi:hypothetical protein
MRSGGGVGKIQAVNLMLKSVLVEEGKTEMAKVL